MILKKTNAVLTWISGLCLVLHLITMSSSMLSVWSDYSLCSKLAWGTANFTALHLILNLIIFFFLHDRADLLRYKKQNALTILQRATAVVMMLMLHPHLKAFGFISAGKALSTGEKSFILITETIFLGDVLLHLAISFPKSLITLGIVKDDKSEKTAKKAAYVVCGLLYVMTLTVLIVFMSGWTGF